MVLSMARNGLLLWIALALPAAARADGFAELKTALLRQQSAASTKGATAPVAGSVRTEVWRRQGEGESLDEDQGQATLGFEDGVLGMRLLYPREVLTRVEQESRARDKDPKARAPTLAAVKALEPRDLHSMLSPAQALLAALDGCKARSEASQEWNGRPSRRLSCELDIAALKGKDRKYVKRFDGLLEVWIDANGMPLATRSHTALSGRAFVVIGFEATSDVEQTFRLVDERLLSVREERRDNGSGAGEKFDSRTVRTLLLPS